MPALISRSRFAHAVEGALARRAAAGCAMTQTKLAAAAGTTPASVSDWLRRKKTPTAASAQRVLDVLGLDWSDIEGRSTPRAHTSQAQDPGVAEGGATQVIFVPRNGRAGAGDLPDADAPSDDTADPYPLHELRRLTQADPAALRSTVVVGDSMEGELRANDTIIYLPCTAFGDAGMYVLYLDGARIVKYVQRLGGGALELIPTNTRYTRERFTPLPDADTPNTYRSDLTGLTSTLAVAGKVVFYPKPA